MPQPPLIAPVTVEGTTVRELPADEWTRLSEVDGPLSGVQLPDTPNARVIVAEDAATGAIRAYWVISAMVHLDPLWIAPEHRHQPKFLLAWIGALLALLQAADVAYVFAMIHDDDQPGNGVLAEHLGLSRMRGSLYGGSIVAAPQESAPWVR